MTWWDAVKIWLAGRREEKFPVPGASTPEPSVEYNGAAEWLAKRANLTTVMGSRQIAEEWTAKARAQAFFSARVAEDHILERLRRVSDAYSSGKIGLAEARTELKRFLRAEGKDDGTSGLRNLASTARLDLILEQNARMAAAVGQYQVGMDPDILERFPCWRYIGSTALNPRDSHARFAGKVFRKDDPIWHKIFPPSDFNCKCSVEDCDDEPDKAPEKIEPPESGFAFDPAHAFEEFDLSSIRNEELRKKTEEGLKQLGVVMQPQGIRLKDTTGIEISETGEYPQGGKYRQMRPVYDAMLKGEDTFKQEIRERGVPEKMNREFVGVFDQSGKPFFLGMGKQGSGSAQFRFYEGDTVIHNHPSGACFSDQDVAIFLNGRLKRMVVITKDREFSLTMPENGVNVNADKIIDKWQKAKETKTDLEAWKEAFNGTGIILSENRNS